jgi:hypothetical protein
LTPFVPPENRPRQNPTGDALGDPNAEPLGEYNPGTFGEKHVDPPVRPPVGNHGDPTWDLNRRQIGGQPHGNLHWRNPWGSQQGDFKGENIRGNHTRRNPRTNTTGDTPRGAPNGFRPRQPHNRKHTRWNTDGVISKSAHTRGTPTKNQLDDHPGDSTDENLQGTPYRKTPEWEYREKSVAAPRGNHLGDPER